MAKEKNGVLTQTYHPLYKEKKKKLQCTNCSKR